MKVQFLTDDEDFVDLWVLEDEIIGFYVPEDANNFDEKILNIIIHGGLIYSVIITPKLQSFLELKFNII